MNRVKRFFNFIISNFGPLVGFYITHQIWGLKAAVLTSVGLVVAEFIWLKSKKEKISSFFYFSSTLVIAFGMLDLSIQEPFFVKFEASLTNLFFAVFLEFLYSRKNLLFRNLQKLKNAHPLNSPKTKKSFSNCLRSFGAYTS